MRRATLQLHVTTQSPSISIHALHEESDPAFAAHFCVYIISIHALHEESDLLQASLDDLPAIISIHALHEESDNIDKQRIYSRVLISIHALHEESDMGVSCSPAFSSFQSTLSMRRATEYPADISELGS